MSLITEEQNTESMGSWLCRAPWRTPGLKKDVVSGSDGRLCHLHESWDCSACPSSPHVRWGSHSCRCSVEVRYWLLDSSSPTLWILFWKSGHGEKWGGAVCSAFLWHKVIPLFPCSQLSFQLLAFSSVPLPNVCRAPDCALGLESQQWARASRPMENTCLGHVSRQLQQQGRQGDVHLCPKLSLESIKENRRKWPIN